MRTAAAVDVEIAAVPRLRSPEVSWSEKDVTSVQKVRDRLDSRLRPGAL